jgi:hypothetical protein
VAIAAALSAVWLLDSTRPLTDVPFTLLTLCGFLAGGRALRARGTKAALGWSTAAWALLLAATLTRFLGLAMLAGLAVAMLLARHALPPHTPRRPSPWPRRLLLLSPAVAVAAVVLAWAFIGTHASPDTPPAHHGSIGVAGRFLGDPGRFLARLPTSLATLGGTLIEPFWRQHVPIVGWLMLPLIIFATVRLARRGNWLLVVPGWLYLLTLICLGATAVSTVRYMLPAVPWLAAWTVLGAADLADRLARRRPRLDSSAAAWIAATVLVLPALPLMARQVYYIHHPDFQRVVDHRRWAGYFNAADWLNANVPADAVVLTDEARVFHLLTARTTRRASPRPDRADTWLADARNAHAGWIIVPAGRPFTDRVLAVLDRDALGHRRHHVVLPTPDLSPGSRHNRGGFIIYRRR